MDLTAVDPAIEAAIEAALKEAKDNKDPASPDKLVLAASAK